MEDIENGGETVNRYTVTINGAQWERITKAEARKLWDAKQRLYIAPCNMRPGGPWGIGAEINSENINNGNFEDMVNEYEYYNCPNSATGEYASFYKPCNC